MLPEEVICLGLGVAVVCSITDVSAVAVVGLNGPRTCVMALIDSRASLDAEDEADPVADPVLQGRL